MFIGQVNELLGHPLLEEELRIKDLQFGDGFLKLLLPCGIEPAGAGESLVFVRQFPAHLLHFFAETREQLHVALPALDFLVEDHAIEAFAAFDQLRRQLEVSVRDESKAMNMHRDASFGFLDPLGNFDFLLARQERHLAHLLQIHPHRIVEDVELRFRLFFFLVSESFLTSL